MFVQRPVSVLKLLSLAAGAAAAAAEMFAMKSSLQPPSHRLITLTQHGLRATFGRFISFNHEEHNDERTMVHGRGYDSGGVFVIAIVCSSYLPVKEDRSFTRAAAKLLEVNCG
ncbi:unnamed protein product [Heligmosomoides polygyrus]|uniref:Secreted protein n=1 Tax=Heligmosomoides polygyrus TaxID=6339 RepID=A0A183FMN8_HELPZ|nr:unnamed protein product [Heligmosomoides polygyrus]